MDWTAAKKLPFDILFLLGGGIALAESFEPTGLSGAIGNLLAPLVGELHPMLLLLVLVSVITLLSEVASNTAIAALFLPLLMAAGRKAGIDPRVLMLPAVVAASCGFMLPIATPPNTLAFATGHVTFRQMARAGALVDVAAIVLMVLVLWFWSLPMLGVDMHARPR
jgi:sodium-dependent dicarboxylate transporter 2/3/5